MGTIEEQAIQELVQNIVQRGDGKVWMDDWRGRFGSLGPTPKDFMEQRPDLFQLNYHGRGFSVELVGDGEAMAKEMGADSGSFDLGGPKKGGPKGGVVLAEPIIGGKGKAGPKGGINLAAPKGQAHSFGKGGDDYGGKGYYGGKRGKGGGANLALPSEAATGELADTAIAEIKDQIARRGEPKVWIDDWRTRYGALGPSPKQFMESRPDVFRLAYQGNRYSVFLADETGGFEAAAQQEDLYWQGRGGTHGMQESTVPGELDVPSDKPDEQACIDEITRLVQQSPDGRIWIPDWFRRFAHLAKSPRSFMESRPDVFALTFKGNTYSVALIGQESGSPQGQPQAIQPTKRAAEPALALTERPRPWKSQRTDPNAPIPAAIGKGAHNNNPRHWTGPSPQSTNAGSAATTSSPADSSSALDYLGDKEEDALAEIFDQLSKPYSNGKVNFPDWVKRFGHLAVNPREFIEGHPDKFEVIPGYGSSYTVELC